MDTRDTRPGTSIDSLDTWLGGVVAGLVAGLVQSLLGAAAAFAMRVDPWPVAKAAALPFVGDRAMDPGFDAGVVTLGLVAHFAVAVAWGLLFAVAFKGLSRPATVAAGGFWGIVVWVVMTYVVMPLVGADEVARSVPIWMAIVQHVAFGLAMGLAFLPFQAPFARRPWDRDVFVRP